MQEEWRQVVGFEGLYSVSNLGRVRSEDREYPHPKGGKRMELKGRVLMLQTTARGYKRTALWFQGVIKNVAVHRLVALAFTANPENKPCVNHIDNDPGNNKVDNLEWVTNKENTQHAINQGRLTPRRSVDPTMLEKARVLVEKGVSHPQIAKQVGCSLYALYKYFPVKGDSKP